MSRIDDFPLDDVLRQQTDRPAGMALRRLGARQRGQLGLLCVPGMALI